MADTADSPGALFVFEGPDNVGKSTLAAEVERTLVRTSRHDVARLAFPGIAQGTLGAHIHELHHHPDRFGIRAITPNGLQALHVAAHLDAIETQIRPLLTRGSIVLLDRYWWSTWVFGLAGGADRQVLEALVRLEQVYWGPVLPRTVFLVDRRIDCASSQEQSTLARIRYEYAALAKREMSRTPVISVQNDGPWKAAIDPIVGTILQLMESAATIELRR